MIICNPRDISYTVAADGKSITFQPCGVTSHNINDIENKYCARCHRFMELVKAARDILKEVTSE